tara:strand:+ start:229 stop:456 length:228 start_codon:yes stop_codon:yes gene_type:complete
MSKTNCLVTENIVNNLKTITSVVEDAREIDVQNLNSLRSELSSVLKSIDSIIQSKNKNNELSNQDIYELSCLLQH